MSVKRLKIDEQTVLKFKKNSIVGKSDCDKIWFGSFFFF